jgi:hypothetical protein
MKFDREELLHNDREIMSHFFLHAVSYEKELNAEWLDKNKSNKSYEITMQIDGVEINPKSFLDHLWDQMDSTADRRAENALKAKVNDPMDRFSEKYDLAIERLSEAFEVIKDVTDSVCWEKCEELRKSN